MKRTLSWALPAAAVVGATALAAGGTAAPPNDPQFTPLTSANQRAKGYAPANRLAGGLQQLAWANGSMAVENPDGIIGWYGYENDVPSPDKPGFPQMVPATPYKDPSAASASEAQKTEPDENTYLVFKKGLSGTDATYNYGTHFLFQGHESGVPSDPNHPSSSPKRSLITRINLDADSDHRVTLLASKDKQGNPIAPIDGSTWDPFARRLIFTTENVDKPTYSATADFPSEVVDISGALGRGGYEGVQNDSAGNLIIVEDIGGSNKTDPNNGNASTTAKRPNSYVYRYVPKTPGDLANGKLQALQVLNQANQPITFESQAPLNNPDQMALHAYGNTFTTKWVTIHDTATDGNASFNANALAKAQPAANKPTPFKRPENARFRPGSKFTELYFDETGDTNNTSPENTTAGGWGGVQKLVQAKPTASTGTLTLFYKGDQKHTGLDNTTFLTKDLVTFVEDAGDTLHEQRNALDSGWVFDVNTDYSQSGAEPKRWLAQGRDASATLDAANGGFSIPDPDDATKTVTRNDGDNEITGAIVSDGDTEKGGILGAKEPKIFQEHWRWFYTQQHGDNVTYEVIPHPIDH